MDSARQNHGPETMIAPLAVAVWCALFSTQVAAQGKSVDARYPDKPVRFLVGQSPGGATDVVARAVSQKMTENIGQSVVVDNRTGASGSIAATMVAVFTNDTNATTAAGMTKSTLTHIMTTIFLTFVIK